MKKQTYRQQNNRPKSPSQKPTPAIKEPLQLTKVKRVAFYITDKVDPKGKQRKVIALGVFYIEALERIGVDNLPAWLGKEVDKYCSINGKDDAWIRIVEYCIVQALLAKIVI
jgi:hypothetical protein